MDKNELLEKFTSLHSAAKSSGNAEDIEVSLSVFKKAFVMLSDTNPRIAKELLECYEGSLNYYNFLTETEAEDVVEKFVNQDGSKGPKWRDPEELLRKVTDMGGKIDSEPHYNKWALYVAMNKASSDNHSTIVKWVGDDKMKYIEACYDIAINYLKDRDKSCWIRPYYNLGE